jgi:hypothetical protein
VAIVDGPIIGHAAPAGDLFRSFPAPFRASRDDAAKLTLHLRNRPDTLRVSPLFAHLFRQM